MRRVIIAQEAGDPDPNWKRAASLLFLRCILIYCVVGFGLAERGLTLTWLLWGVLCIEMGAGLLAYLAKRGSATADIGGLAAGLTPAFFLTTALGLWLCSGAGAVHLWVLAFCACLSSLLTAIQLRHFKLTSERRTHRRKKVIREAREIVLVKTGRLDFKSLQKDGWKMQAIGIILPVCAIALVAPLAPARWGAEIPAPLLLFAAYGFAVFSIGWYFLTSHIIAGLRLLRAERAGPLD